MCDCELCADDLGYLIKQISDKMRANADAAFRKHGLTFSQVHVLDFVLACGGSATQKEIEIYLGVSHPTIVGLVSRLEKAGFVTSHIDENNRRNKIVCVTSAANQRKPEKGSSGDGSAARASAGTAGTRTAHAFAEQTVSNFVIQRIVQKGV